jgi:ankyrin repeat protein
VVHEELSRSPHQVEACDDPADELLRLGCLNYGNDSPERWAAARQLLADDPSLSGRSLHTAAACGDVEATARLLGDGADPNEEGGPFRWPPLLYLTCARMGTGSPLAVAQALLDAKADPNAGYLWDGLPSPFTALTGVFGRGEQGAPPHDDELALARLLLEAGAEANDSQTIYDRGLGDAPTDDVEWLELLYEFGLGRGDGGPWKQRLADEHQSIAEMIGDLLQHAAEHDLRRRVDVLLAHGADPNEPGCHPSFGGRRPYEGAVGHGNLAVAAALEAAGADTSTIDDVTRFVGACLAGQRVDAEPDLVERARTAHPGLVDVAADLRRPEAARVLVELGWDVNHPRFATALHSAAWNKDRAMCEVLLDLGADPTIRDRTHDSSATGWASTAGDVPLGNYLEARRILADNEYLTLATADAEGRPWATPVWFAHDRLDRFVWVSKPGARHSRNVAAQPRVGIVVFDSKARPDDGSGAYFDAVAAEVPDDELDEALARFSDRSVAHDLPPWDRSQVTGDARFRLYAATVESAWVLDAHDERQPVERH